MIKKTSLALIFCAFLCFTQPNTHAGRTTVITTVHEEPSLLELLWKIDTKLGAYITVGAFAGGIIGFIAYLIEKAEESKRRSWKRGY